MAYIAPNTTIQFFKNTGLSMSHENSLYFATEQDKNLYFTNWSTQVGVVQQTYQRANRSFCRVQSTMAVMYDVDYMRFVNISFENKWFYAFVIAINYINNTTVEVEYVLDPLMTWMGNFTLKECYIERQHTIRDGVGNNICEEGIPVGNYVTELQTAIAQYGPENAVARMAVARGDAVQTRGGIYAGSVSVDCASSEELYNNLQTFVEENQSDSVISIVMIPQAYRDPTVQYNRNAGTLPKPYNGFSGYTPRNNKLYCYPYKYCTIDNGEGSTIDLMYEYFGTVPDATSSGTLSFTVAGCGYSNGCNVMIYPNNYKGNSGLEYRLVMSHFPQCSFAIDSYKAYLAQRNAYFPQEMAIAQAQGMNNIGASAVRGGLQGVANASATGGLIDRLVGGVSGAMAGAGTAAIDTANDLANRTTENLLINQIRPESPSIAHGTPSADIMWSIGNKSFMIYEKAITKNYAMMLDSYFDMYGYAVKQHGVPNMNARPHWTFVKTIGCDCAGNVPASDKKQIENIFDGGVRFWHNLIEMGNYELDNSPA